MLKLDFSIASSAERAIYVNTNMDPTANYSKKELETISNYILYGKDEDGTSIVDRKEVQIKTKHGTYSRKEDESLDALMEKPTFDECSFQNSSIKYKNEKPTISREKDKDIPGMRELWEAIDRVQDEIEQRQARGEPSNRGKLYELKHYLIELRRQQYTLKDSIKPTICKTKVNISPSHFQADAAVPWDCENSDFSIAPLGLYSSNPKRFDDPRAVEEIDYQYNGKAKYILDFRNPIHIYELFEKKLELEKDGYMSVEYIPFLILETLDFYTSRANLNEEQKRILHLKINKVSNQTICDILNKEFNVTHSANYISTIYKQKICKKIADAAILHYDYYLNREVATAWKKCSKCGKYKLRDTREYMRRKRSSDGLSSCCKQCDKEKR